MLSVRTASFVAASVFSGSCAEGLLSCVSVDSICSAEKAKVLSPLPTDCVTDLSLVNSRMRSAAPRYCSEMKKVVSTIEKTCNDTK